MQFILNALTQCKEYKELSDALKKKQLPLAIWGVPNSLKASFCYALCQQQKKKAVVIVPQEDIVKTQFALSCHFGDGVIVFPSKEFLFRNVESASHEEDIARLSVLTQLINNDYNALIISPEALLRYTMPKEKYLSLCIKIVKNKEFPLNKAIEFLINCGYSRCEKIEGKGQFSNRGGILDFFPPHSENPIRIEFFGETPDLIGEFDIISQRKINNLDFAQITPVLELILNNKEKQELINKINELQANFIHKKSSQKAIDILKHDIEIINEGINLASIDRYIPLTNKQKTTVLDYTEGALVFAFELARVRENINGFIWRLNEDIKTLAEEGVPFCKGDYCIDSLCFDTIIERKGAIIFEALSRSEGEIRLKFLSSINAKQTSPWRGNISVLVDDIIYHNKNKDKVIISAANIKHAEWLAMELREKGIIASFSSKIPERIEDGQVIVVPFPFGTGYEIPSAKFAIFSDSNIEHIINKKPIKPSKNVKDIKLIKSLSDLKTGDYIVHNDYGIGIFDGIFNSTVNEITKDKIKIRYSGTDVLYIPCSRLDLIAKYTGADTAGVKLNKLGTADWVKAKARVKKAVADLANYLIDLYAKRQSVKGYAFSHDTQWQNEFEQRFEYEETDDQLKCVKEIKKDMEKSIPMDRLLCGDVGVGKTEVALRATFKCVADDKQVSILVPTTVLAWQHYQTISKRMADYPITVEMLSRFRTPKEQEKIIKKLKTGEIDIIIGTHRLLQKDIVFKNLGLAIVDEEQRFGVTHKEKLKELTKEVDILTLSATPIPRTLNMALTGIRDLSLIEEPPHDRHPIATYVAEYDYSIITDAIIKEISRNGQVYFLHNRVETIYKMANKLSELVPNARISVAHGQMNETELSSVWESLVNGEVDVLVCTTIIETGVDVPNVNTLIIDDADKLGLAQLHQIRGRIGRSARRAYAYLTYKRGKVLTEDAAKRLTAIREFTEFGSGLKIAMRDLEIRGAGNVLGAEQSGHLHSVGYDMYISLLEQAVKDHNGEQIKIKNCIIDLNISAFIPDSYIKGNETRLDIYKKIAAIRSKDDELDVTDEILDRFGEPPEQVIKLIKIACLKQNAIEVGITEIAQNGNILMFYLTDVNIEVISKLAGKFKGRVMFSLTGRPYISLKIANDEVLTLLERFLNDFVEINKK